MRIERTKEVEAPEVKKKKRRAISSPSHLYGFFYYGFLNIQALPASAATLLRPLSAASRESYDRRETR